MITHERQRNTRYTDRVLRCCAIFVSTAAMCQPGGFTCPLAGAPQIRQGDAVAASGGRFDSSRGNGKAHGALDLNAKLGDAVFASLDGRVAVAQKDWGAMGHTVIIDHGSGAYTIYGHLNSIDVKEGDSIKAQSKVGSVGYTGNASALKDKGLPPHLHFALIQAGKSGLADEGKPLRKMKEWGDFWHKIFDIELAGPVNPVLFMAQGLTCWTGSTTVGALGEK